MFAAATACSAPAQTRADAEPAPKPSAEELARLKQNPVSGLRQVQLVANVASRVPGTDDSASAFSLQPVWPIALNDDWRVITYTIIPFL